MMVKRSAALLCLMLHSARSAFVPAARVLQRPKFAGVLMTENQQPEELSKPAVRVQLISQTGIAGLSPQQQQDQKQYVSVPAPGSQQPAPPSFVQRARGPFTGFTLLATAAVASWQSNRIYKQRQASLLDEFANTMVYHFADPAEMKAAVRSFRSQLGPGPYKQKMFKSFAIALATERPLSITAIEALQTAVGLLQLTQAAVGELYAACADELQGQPSVLGKLVFLAERATPEAGSAAAMRGRFPNFGEETVAILQGALLTSLYKDMCRALPADAPPPAGIEVLKLSAEEAASLMKETHDEIAAAEAKVLEEQQEKERAKQLEMAIKTAEDFKSGPSAEEELETASRAGGTHEYECQKCGYTLFPASGREHKFFGANFKCPQCGAGKSEFVENVD